MMFMMCIQLYTSRVVLNTLGVEDYGIYNVVGGVVAMFGFLNSAMTTSTQRYLTFELGKGNFEKLKKVFSTSLKIHFFISILVAILAESVGLWFLYEKMIIPETRLNAAMWVFQLSIFTTVVAITSYPYNAAIVAHEKMSAFAGVSIIEAILKLAIVFLLSIGNFDKLIMYAILLATIQLIVRIIYTSYCTKNFKETKLSSTHDRDLFKEMLSFAGWNLWGNLAAILFNQGLNMMLNVFFGPTINAARAIAVQVQNAVQQFSSNFQMALNPQITKTYAAGKFSEMHHLIFRSSRFTFLLLFILCLPILIETPFILKLWLRNAPETTTTFLRIIIITMIVDSSANSLMISAAATGKVRRYQIIVGGILLTIVPVSYIVLKMGGAPWSVFVVHLIVCCIAFVTRLFIIKPMIGLKLSHFTKNVIVKCFAVSAVTLAFTMPLKFILKEGITSSIVTIAFCIFTATTASFFIGLDNDERALVKSKISKLKEKMGKR